MPLAIPTLSRVDASEPDKIIKAMRIHGCCVIKNFTTPEIVDRVNAETRPWLDNDKPWKGDLFPPQTRRCTRLISRSPSARNNWLTHPILSLLTSIFVDKTTSNYYGETKHTYTSKAIASITLTMEIGPGASAQRLHRDDKNFHIHHADQTRTGYIPQSDVLLAALIPGVDTRAENGATLTIPGSHLWDDERAPRVEEAAFAELEKGDAYVMLGSLYHAGGANSTADEKRTMHGLFFCRGYLRQEENQYLIHDKEEVLSWSPEVQRIMGYTVSSPNIGFVDFVNPSQFLSGSYDPDNLHDLDPSQESKTDKKG